MFLEIPCRFFEAFFSVILCHIDFDLCVNLFDICSSEFIVLLVHDFPVSFCDFLEIFSADCLCKFPSLFKLKLIKLPLADRREENIGFWINEKVCLRILLFVRRMFFTFLAHDLVLCGDSVFLVFDVLCVNLFDLFSLNLFLYI